MGKEFLIDTDAVIEFLGATLPGSGSEWLQELVNGQKHCLSVINQIELLGYDGNDGEMQTLEEFISFSEIIPLTEEIAVRTIELRKKYKIKLPDAIIAATAMHYGLSLITRNISDFEKISKLNLINPHLK